MEDEEEYFFCDELYDENEEGLPEIDMEALKKKFNEKLRESGCDPLEDIEIDPDFFDDEEDF